MEGVLVSATRAGSNITVTVVTGADGRYSFPQNRLAPANMPLACARSAMSSTSPARPT